MPQNDPPALIAACGSGSGASSTTPVTMHLLADLVARGLDCDQGVLVVLDGGKALRSVIDEVFGPGAALHPSQGTQRADHLPERDGPAVKDRLRRAWDYRRPRARARRAAHARRGA